MKKVVLLVLVLSLLSVGAFAVSEDLSSMSDEDIISLLGKVTAEYDSRSLGRHGVLGEGIYVVGEDIAEGLYNIKSAGDWLSSFYIYPSKDAYDMYTELIKIDKDISRDLKMVNNKEYDKYSLSNGSILVVKGSPLELQEVKNTLAP